MFVKQGAGYAAAQHIALLWLLATVANINWASYRHLSFDTDTKQISFQYFTVFSFERTLSFSLSTSQSHFGWYQKSFECWYPALMSLQYNCFHSLKLLSWYLAKILQLMYWSQKCSSFYLNTWVTCVFSVYFSFSNNDWACFLSALFNKARNRHVITTNSETFQFTCNESHGI